MIKHARSFAIDAHGDQQYGDRPYAYHLDRVANHLVPYGEIALVIGYLHDVVEDTAIGLEAIALEFGDRVADCVGLLTDEPGANRKERKARTYEKLSHVAGDAELALVVKAADRLANVEACIADRKFSLYEVYRKEHAAFKEAAYREGLCDPIWDELDSLLQKNDEF
ncbi:MAG: HD domain-containing protein [Gammaproteobacteria bacterium]